MPTPGWIGKSPDPAEIVLTVHEGGRLSLGTVTVQGVRPSEAKKLAKLYARPAAKGLPIIAGSPPFREEDVETGLSYVRQELNAQGFWNAEARITSRITDPATGATNLVIDVRPGPLFRIAEVKVASPDGRGVAETRAAVKPYVSQDGHHRKSQRHAPGGGADLREQRLSGRENHHGPHARTRRVSSRSSTSISASGSGCARSTSRASCAPIPSASKTA